MGYSVLGPGANSAAGTAYRREREGSMAVPSRMSTRRFPRSLRLRLRVAYAKAWETLLEAHTAQAMQFVHEFAPRVSVLQAMDLYFRVVAVPAPMEEPVRSRALSGLDLDCLLPRMPLPTLRGWSRFRVDLQIENARSRRRFHEKTMQLARMAGARAAEDIQAAHVANALNFVTLLAEHLPVDRAVNHYVREFSLPLHTAAGVNQRAQAQVAAEHLAAQSSVPGFSLSRRAGLVVGYPATDGG